jgi:hypothetical protein
MKKLLFCLTALLCVMGVSAQSRSMTAVIPQDYQCSINMTIDNQSFALTPQKVSAVEVDSTHVQMILYHNRGNAKVTLPVSYDLILDAVKVAWDFAHKVNLITKEQYQAGLREYERQRK